MNLEDRPKFKGVFHAFLAGMYLLYLPRLIPLIPSDKIEVTGLYLFGLIGHLIASANLHLIVRVPEAQSFWRRLDHIMIFVYIYGGYRMTIDCLIPNVHPIVSYFLNFGTILGIILRIGWTDLHPFLIGTPYVMVGWSILLDPSAIHYGFTHLPAAATLCLIMGLTHTLGALVYIFRWPNPWPQYIEFHEVFHFLSGIGTILLTYFVFGYCLPLSQSEI